jgi:DHA2 family multidrug resistance protein-like MFS transporter
LTIASGIIVAALFVRRQRMLTHPLIDLGLFRVRAFSAALGAYTLATFVAFGIFLFVAQYLQLVRRLSTFQTGLCMLPIFVAFIVGSMVAPIIARRVRASLLMGAGLVFAAVGFLMLTRVDATSKTEMIVVGCLIYSLGLAPVFTLTTDFIVGAAPPERAGTAAAISETGSELGGALGIAVLGSFGTAVYRRAMSGAVPHGISSEASEVARGTIGGAVAIARELPTRVAAELLTAAKDAFSQSLMVTAAVSAAVVIATAIAVVLVLRKVPRPA